MRRLFWAILLLLVMQTGIASAEITGTVKINIINRAPEILHLEIMPPEPYPDSELLCDAIVEDEVVEAVFVDYGWFVDGIEIFERSKIMIGAPAGSVVECRAMPIDPSGAYGDWKSASTVIGTPPGRLRFTKTLLNTFGVESDYKRSAEVESQGMGAITGYIVYEGIGETNMIWAMIVIVFIMALINVHLVLRHRQKRTQ